MGNGVAVARSRPAAFRTERDDAWWAGPLSTLAVLSAFVVYATVRVFMNAHYETGELLSPLYSPKFAVPQSFPAWFSPALFVMWVPVSLRATCYYYRKAYYRSFAGHPPACAVGEPPGRGEAYLGEHGILAVQNLHRYALYLAMLFPIFLWHDVWKSLWPGGAFGVTVGSVVLAANAFLLTGYTVSCHSLRHIVGGRLDCFSCSASSRLRYSLWNKLTRLNEQHHLWAWFSLVVVAFADFYVWMVSAGHWTNLRLV